MTHFIMVYKIGLCVFSALIKHDSEDQNNQIVVNQYVVDHFFLNKAEPCLIESHQCFFALPVVRP